MLHEEFLSEIQQLIQVRAAGRFDFLVGGERVDDLLSLAPTQLEKRRVVRLRRVGDGHARWRTILIASLGSQRELEMALRWSAEVRDSLLEPETADLYLILLVRELSYDDASAIEANEQFCRKFVLRPEEMPTEMLDRTFLSQAGPDSAEMTLADPLSVALARTAGTHSWIDDERLEAWRSTLLSGKTGSELADALLSSLPSAMGGL